MRTSWVTQVGLTPRVCAIIGDRRRDVEKPVKMQAKTRVIRQGRPRSTRKHREEETFSTPSCDGPQSHLHSASQVFAVSNN